MSAPLALDPRYTLRAMGVNDNATDAVTILEHAVSQACAELEAVEAVLTKLDQTSVLVSVVEGIRNRLELANESGDLLAALLAESEADQ